LMPLGAQLVMKTVDAISDNHILPVEQETLIISENDLKFAPKIFNETCKIDWNKSCDEIYNLIRGLSPYPTAWTILKTNKGEPIHCKIFDSEKIILSHSLTPGTIDFSDKNCLKIAASDGFIQVKNIQQAGKKRMAVEDFLRGREINFLC